MSETTLIQHARATLSNGDVRLFRNNTGGLQDAKGRWVQFGLCTGSSDLIGFKVLTVTTDMVGSRLAVFVALEGKTATGKATPEQMAFVAMVKSSGGRAGIFRSLDEAIAILEGK